jgi:hypothetical protein
MKTNPVSDNERPRCNTRYRLSTPIRHNTNRCTLLASCWPVVRTISSLSGPLGDRRATSIGDQVLVIAWGEQIALMNWAMACSGR